MDIGKYGKHAQAILLYIYDNQEIPITQLSKLVKNSQTYSRTVHLFEEDGIIKSRELIHNRRYVMISLTDKGIKLAEGLRKAEQEVFGGNNSEVPTLPSNYDDQFNNLSVLTPMNAHDYIAVKDLNYDGTGHDRVVYVYIKPNGNNILRLWCELDKTYNCVHTRYAWSLPDVQAMIQIKCAKVNIKKVDRSGN